MRFPNSHILNCEKAKYLVSEATWWNRLLTFHGIFEISHSNKEKQAIVHGYGTGQKCYGFIGKLLSSEKCDVIDNNEEACIGCKDRECNLLFFEKAEKAFIGLHPLGDVWNMQNRKEKKREIFELERANRPREYGGKDPLGATLRRIGLIVHLIRKGFVTFSAP